MNVSKRISDTAPKSLMVYRPIISPADTRAGRSWGSVTVKNTRVLDAPSPVAASSVAGSINRRAGTTMRWAIGAKNSESASQAPTKPYGVGISNPSQLEISPSEPVAPMMVRAAM